MYTNILVGLDGSSYAAAAEDLAIALARRLGAGLTAVHVVDSSLLEGAFITDISGSMGFEPFLNLQAQMEGTLLELAAVIRTRFLARCQEAGVEGRFAVEHASVPQGLCRAARLADLLVVGQRGVNSRFHEDLLGPNTGALLRRCPIPVLAVPESGAMPARPLLAYDGSPKAARALHHAGELARQLGAPLAVATVDQDATRAKTRLDEAAVYLGRFGVELELRHEPGEDVEARLLALLEPGGYDLVLLGAHGHARVVELVLGSTTETLARKARVPVLCVTRA